MYLICDMYLSYNNIINKPFSAKQIVAILFTCVLTSMQNYVAIGPKDLKGGGGQIDPPPPPSKNLLSKSPVKIGLTNTCLKSMSWKGTVPF